jgi:hypothetical protein
MANPIPNNPLVSTTGGIFQGDLILVSGLVAALKDVRKNQWLLDFVFNSLTQDPVSYAHYGQNEVNAAKTWLLNQDIPIVPAYTLTSLKFPSVDVLLESSVEAESTLGDINDQVSEPIDAITPGIAQPITLFGPFSASYNPLTGTVTLPFATALIQAGQAAIVDTNSNIAYQIIKVVDAQNYDILPLINPLPNFNQATIVPASVLFTNNMGGVFMKETYSIGLHVAGEPTNLYRLQSLIIFILMRYKNIYFENRGLRRATVTMGRFEKDETFEGQIVYSRYINFQCFTKYQWPIDIEPPLTAILPIVQVINPLPTPPTYLQQVQLQGWQLLSDPLPSIK